MMHRSRHSEPVTALPVIVTLHDHPSKPQVRHASIGAARRQRLVGVTGVSEGHRQPVTALTVIMALHRHPSTPGQA